MSQITTHLPDEVLAALDQAASVLRCPRAEIVRLAIERYLENFDDLSVAVGRLRDPSDAVLDWEGVRSAIAARRPLPPRPIAPEGSPTRQRRSPVGGPPAGRWFAAGRPPTSARADARSHRADQSGAARRQPPPESARNVLPPTRGTRARTGSGPGAAPSTRPRT